MEPLLSVQNLSKIYPGKGKKTAVDGISFDLQPGQILGLLGPNGSGKTTTIQMLLGTLSPTSGSILYFGKDLEKERSSVLQHISFASTYTSLPWILSVGENLIVFGRLYGKSPKESQKAFRPLLERFGLAKLEHVKVASLSAGQITRLMLVKAFFIGPKIVLLDEPTASLDPDVAKEICSFILEEREKRGVSILFTSHKMEEASLLCDRIIFLKQGKIIANDLPKNLMRMVSSFKLKLLIPDGMERTVALALKRGLLPTVENKLLTVTIEEPMIPLFLSDIAKADILYASIQIEEPSLEDFFLHVAKENS